jgi:hypothetical protein
LKADTFALYIPGIELPLRVGETLESSGLPSEVYLVVLCVVNIADTLRVKSADMTDAQLEIACSTEACQGGDIIDLHGCTNLQNTDCLVKLEQMQELDTSGCKVANRFITAHK